MTATIDTLDRIYDLADTIEAAMESKPLGTGWTPSAVARKAKVSTDDARRALDLMHQDDEIAADGNGAWRRYYLKSWRYPWTNQDGTPSRTPVAA